MARILIFGSVAESLVSFRGPLLKELVARGHHVFACAPNAPQEIKDTLTEMQVTYLNVKLNRTGQNLIQDLRSLCGLIKIFKNIKPDIFLGYTVKPVVYGSLAAHISKVPKIYSIITGLGDAFLESNFRTRALGIIVRKLYRWALSYNDKIFFQNPDDLQLFNTKRLIKNPDQAILVNGSGIDVDLFQTAPYPAIPSFLLIARLLKEKGVYEYVEAARIVKQTYPTIKFKLVGYIDNKPSAISEQELQTWTQAGTIEYLGYLRDVRPAITDASVYVLPSYREGTPHTVLEAMAMARPVITTDVPGCRETVRDRENGFLVPLRNIPALADAMIHFIQHPDDIQRMGQAGRQIAEKKYDVHKVNAIIFRAMDLSR